MDTPICHCYLGQSLWLGIDTMQSKIKCHCPNNTDYNSLVYMHYCRLTLSDPLMHLKPAQALRGDPTGVAEQITNCLCLAQMYQSIILRWQELKMWLFNRIH